MTALLTVDPTTAVENQSVQLAGTGGADAKNRVLLDGTVVWSGCSAATISPALAVGGAVATQTFRWEQYVAGSWTLADDVTVSVVAPSGGGIITPFPGSGPRTAAALKAMIENINVEIIEIAAGPYTGFSVYIGIDRTSAHPLVIRPAPGAAVIFDGSGTGGVGLFYFGSFIGQARGKTSYITVDAAGTGGSFAATNYSIIDTGLVCTGWASHITVNGFTVTNCTGTPSQTSSHMVYVSSDGVHRGDHITANGWNVTGDVARTLNGLQTFHEPNADTVVAHSWTVTKLHRWMYLWADATLIDIDGWNGTNCDASVDAQQSSSGVVKNCNGHGSCGPLAPGSGQWGNLAVTDGGGNTP